jgi:hypothetical protein
MSNNIEAELEGAVTIPTNELGVPTRFAQLSDEQVAKALSDGSLEFVALVTSTTPVSLMERRARTLGRRKEAQKRIPTITRLAELTNDQFGVIPDQHIMLLSSLLGITVDQLIERRHSRRLAMGLETKPVKVKAEKAPVEVKAEKKAPKAKATKAAPKVKAARKPRTQKALDTMPDAEAEAALVADFEASAAVED